MAATATAELKQNKKNLEVVVNFVGFPSTGGIKYNEPHFRVVVNGEVVDERAHRFTGAVCVADKVKVPIEKGDAVKVIAYWSQFEIRNGIGRSATIIASTEA